MKHRLLTLIFAIALGTTALFAQLIAIDGSFDDWGNVPAERLTEDSIDGNAAFTNLTNIKFCSDEQYLYFYFEYINGTYEIENEDYSGYEVQNFDIMIDTDGNAQTGYNTGLWQPSGVNYLIEAGAEDMQYASLFAFSGASQDEWGWEATGIGNYIQASAPQLLGNGHYALEGSILRSMIPNLATFNVGVYTTNSNWAETGILPQVSVEDGGELGHQALLSVPLYEEPEDPDPYENSTTTGAFTINASGDQVSFAHGNLQYKASTDSWRFAPRQYDILGDANSAISQHNTGWIDLFGWGTGDHPTEHNIVDYYYTNFTDWGWGSWRTLTHEEWQYVFYTRPNHDNLRSQATVCGVHGYILLPDNFVLPDGLAWTPMTDDWSINSYNNAAWNQMEENGAVFFPCAGFRFDVYMYNIGTYGYYWSSTRYTEIIEDSASAWCMYFKEDTASAIDFIGLNNGASVRLVKAVTQVINGLENTSDLKKNEKEIRNGQILIIRGDKTYTVTGQEVQ